MRFKDRTGSILEDKTLTTELQSAEKLFSVRFGKRHLFIPRLFCTLSFAYADMHHAYLQTEYIECLTSEFPAEYNVYRLFFCTEAEDQPLKLVVDSAVKAERILSKLAVYAPHVELRPEICVAAQGSFSKP